MTNRTACCCDKATTSRDAQKFSLIIDGVDLQFALPHPMDEVLPGVPWGRHDQLFTVSYWVVQYTLQQHVGPPIRNRLGDTLLEETAACLLGGYGIKAEIGLAAFARLKARGLFANGTASEADFRDALREPLLVNGREVKYRFAVQRSRYLAEVSRGIPFEKEPENDIAFRNWMLKFPGIGLKTASWVTRNWKDSDSVAIIDTHLLRAGQLIGLYQHQSPSADYLELEQLFLELAAQLNVRASVLDSTIWYQMKTWGKLADTKNGQREVRDHEWKRRGN